MKEINVRDFGAAGDNRSDDLPAMQKALDSGEKFVYIPAGRYMLRGTLTLRSGTRLLLHPEAYMKFGDGCGKKADSFLLSNESGAENITVEGGVWDGNAANNPRVADGGEPYLGVLIAFGDMKNLTLRNMTVRNAESFHIRLNYVKDFVVEDICFDDNEICANQDGIHVAGGCENGVIRNIRAVGPSSPNDDMISLVSGFSREAMAPCDPAWGQKDGNIRNIRIYGLYAENTFSFLRLLAETYSIEDVTVSGVTGGCYYLGAQMQISPYLRNRGDFTVSHLGTGNIKNVRLSDWNIWYKYRYVSNRMSDDDYTYQVNALFDIEQGIEGLVLEHFYRDISKDKMPELPTLSLMNQRPNSIELKPSAGSAVKMGGRDAAVCGIICETMEPGDAMKVYGSIEYLSVNI